MEEDVECIMKEQDVIKNDQADRKNKKRILKLKM